MYRIPANLSSSVMKLVQVLLPALAAVGSAVPQGYRITTLPATAFYTGGGISSGSIQNLGSVHSLHSGSNGGFSKDPDISGADHFPNVGVIGSNGPEFGKNGFSSREQSKSDDSADNFISSGHAAFGKLKNTVSSSDYVYSSNGGQSPGLLKFRGIHSPNFWMPSDGCKEGEIRQEDGSCVTDLITGKVFLFDAPEQPVKPTGPPPYIPPPKVNQIILFIRLPEAEQGPDPIIVPPPRQDISVFLLKAHGQESQPVVEVSLPSLTKPGVYYVDFGDNVTIPSGLYLQTALSVISRDEDRPLSDSGSHNVADSDFIQKLSLEEHTSSSSNRDQDSKISFSAGNENYNSNHNGNNGFSIGEDTEARSW